MFGIGLSELILIFLVLIIFIKPDDLPNFLRKAGRFYGKAKKLYNELIQVKDKVLKEINEAATLEEASKNAVKTPSEPTPVEEAKAPLALPDMPPSSTPEKEEAPSEPEKGV